MNRVSRETRRNVETLKQSSDKSELIFSEELRWRVYDKSPVKCTVFHSSADFIKTEKEEHVLALPHSRTCHSLSQPPAELFATLPLVSPAHVGIFPIKNDSMLIN